MKKPTMEVVLIGWLQDKPFIQFHHYQESPKRTTYILVSKTKTVDKLDLAVLKKLTTPLLEIVVIENFKAFRFRNKERIL